jgi:predicted O-methyltransferase YrrM
MVVTENTNPTNQLALSYYHSGYTLYKQKAFKIAVHCFEKALALSSSLDLNSIVDIHYYSIMALLRSDNLERAEQTFKETQQLEGFKNTKKFYKLRAEIENKHKGYEFTKDWFPKHIKNWTNSLQKFVNQPIKALEIGSWEGYATCWLLDNVLTNDMARITCIDTFAGSYSLKQRLDASHFSNLESRFDFNIKKSGSAYKVEKIVGSSHQVLPALLPLSYDLAYIDGSHLASDVLLDAELTWRLLKVGGIIIFDDYNMTFDNNPSQNTCLGIDAFLNDYSNQIEIIYKSEQVTIKKLVNKIILESGGQ